MPDPAPGARAPASGAPADPRSSEAPAGIVALARQRWEARAARDWRAADELRARIEEAGWKVVDAGAGFTLAPARPPDIVDEGRVLYGGAAAVPSRLGTPPDRTATLVLRWPDEPTRSAACLMWLGALGRADFQVVVVIDGSANAPRIILARLTEATRTPLTETGRPDAPEGGSVLSATPDAPAPEVEVLWTSAPLGPGASLAAAARRARAGIIVALEPGVPAGADVPPRPDVPTGPDATAGPGGAIETSLLPGTEVLARAVAALEDPGVAVVGFPGLRSADFHRFRAAGPGPVTAIGAACLAFRREDVARRDEGDERLHLAESVAVWWSLLLRDAGPGAVPRRALALEPPSGEGGGLVPRAGVPRDGRARRDAYRIAERFRGRSELADREGGRREPDRGPG